MGARKRVENGRVEPLCTGAPLWQLLWLQDSMPVVPHGGGGWSPGRGLLCHPKLAKEGGRGGVSPTSTDLQQVANSVQNKDSLERGKKEK